MTGYRRGCFGILHTAGEDEMPVYLIDGGIERRRQEAYDFKNDERKGYGGYLFQYTLRGRGYFEKDGIIYDIVPGKAFLVSFPENSRYYMGRGPEEEWEFIYLHFAGSAAGQIIEKLVRTYGPVIDLDRGGSAVQGALLLQNKMTDGHRMEKYADGEAMYGFLCALLREAGQPLIQDPNSAVKAAAEAMEKEYGILEGIEPLADRFHMSFAHFSRRFKDELGMSPKQYLTNLRIQGAIRELLNTDEPLETIARNNGFSNDNYFCKVFKKVTGLTPSEYRARK